MNTNSVFTVTSTDLLGQITNVQLGNAFGCSGQNTSPQLSWTNAPEETKAFAVTMYDLNAPTGSGFWHWVTYNIPGNINKILSGAGDTTTNVLPKEAVHALNDAGTKGYAGPCPQPNTLHTYLITVYALKAPIDVAENACGALVGFMLHNNLLAKASLVAYGQG